MDHRRAAFAALCCLVAPLWSADLSTLTDPRPASRIVDTVRVLGDGDRSRLAAEIDRIRQEHGGELMVVAVDTSGGAVLRQAGTALFNRWRIGRTVRDDGVLLVIAMEDRRCEIILGNGVDSDAQVEASQRIFDEDMKPRLRAGDPGDALVVGAQAIARRIYGLSGDPTPSAPRVERVALEPTSPGASLSPEASLPFDSAPSPMPSTSSPPPPLRVSHRRSEPQGPAVSGIALIVGGIITAVVGGFGTRLWLRHRSRRCPNCRMPMQRLGEAVDDQYLTSGQRAEERVGSVDYDVWACTGCDHVITLRWGAIFTRYSACPGCQAKTRSSRSTTLQAATYTSGGLVRVDESCSHCQWKNSYTRTTPRLQRSSNRGFRGGFGGSGGGRSGGFGGSGGGRSSGRGGGGGW